MNNKIMLNLLFGCGHTGSKIISKIIGEHSNVSIILSQKFSTPDKGYFVLICFKEI